MRTVYFELTPRNNKNSWKNKLLNRLKNSKWKVFQSLYYFLQAMFPSLYEIHVCNTMICSTLHLPYMIDRQVALILLKLEGHIIAILLASRWFLSFTSWYSSLQWLKIRYPSYFIPYTKLFVIPWFHIQTVLMDLENNYYSSSSLYAVMIQVAIMLLDRCFYVKV